MFKSIKQTQQGKHPNSSRETGVTRVQYLLHLALALTFMIAGSPLCSAQTECFGGQKFPKLLGAQTEIADSQYMAITGSYESQAVFVAGLTHATSIYQYPYPAPLSVVSRIDLTRATYVFRQVFHADEIETITALALSPDNSKLAVHAMKWNSGTIGESSFLFVVSAMDGSYISRLIKITHGETGQGEAIVRSPGLYFDDYDRVYAAFNLIAPNQRNSDNGNIQNYQGKLIVGAMNIATETMDYYEEQELYFGRSAALAYKDYGETAANLFVGGATDHCHVTDVSQPKCWTLSINRLAYDGSAESLTQINPYGGSIYHNDESTAPYIDHMHLDDVSDPSKEWLFGTTRSSSDSATGSFLFLWRIDLDTAHNPRSDNMQIMKLDSSNFPGSSYVSGVKPTMESDTIHLLYKSGAVGGKIYYMVYDFNSSSATTTLLYTGIHGTNEAFFIGGMQESVSGLSLERAFITGLAQSMKPKDGWDPDYPQDVGVVLASLRETESCLIEPSETASVPVTHMSTATIENNFQQFGTSTFGLSTIIDYNILSRFWSLYSVEWVDDSWCSNYYTWVNGIEGGYLPQGSVCTDFNGKTGTVPFVPFTITDPSGCTDELLWTYSIIYDYAAALEYVKVTADSINHVIRVSSLASDNFENADQYQFVVLGMLPDGVTIQSFPFTLNYQPCAYPNFVAPDTVDVVYTTGDSYDQFEVGEFSVDQEACEGLVTYTNVITPHNNSVFYTNNGIGRTVGWASNDENNEGTYTVTVQAEAGCKIEEKSYTVIVRSRCYSMPLALEEFGDPVFVSQSQSVWGDPLNIEWDDFIMSQEDQFLNCGFPSFQILTEDEQPLDPDVFEYYYDFDIYMHYLSVQTSDMSKVGTYNLVVKAYNEFYPSNFVTKSFSIEINMSACETITGTPSSLTDKEYTISRTALMTPKFAEFNMSPAYCPVTYSFTVSPPLPAADSSAISISDRRFYFQTMQIDLEDTYTITVSAVSPTGLTSSASFEFDVVFINPCLTAEFSISPSIFESPIVFELGGSANDQELLDQNVESTEFSWVCPDIIFQVVERDGSPMNPDIFTYDNAQQTLTTFTNDPSTTANSPYLLTLKARYDGDRYSFETTTGVLDFEIEVFNPCEDPTVLSAPSQASPGNYLYTGTNPSLDFTLNPFEVQPSNCYQFIQYSCQVTAGSRSDLCSVNDGQTVGIFNGSTGDYSFSSADIDGFPPGSYTLEITGTIGSKTATASFGIVMEHPCPTTALSLQPSPFTDSEYLLRSNEMSQSWDISNMLSSGTEIDCGPVSIEFYMDDGSYPSFLLFDDDRSAQPYKFTTMYSDDDSLAGTYPIVYTAYYTNYADNQIQQPDPFIITVVDPCAFGVDSVVAPSLQDQTYTITDTSVNYQLPEFTVNPTDCAVVQYSYQVSSQGEGVVTFNSATRTFTFQYSADLTLSGPVSTDYVITVTGTAGDIDPKTVDASFTLTVRNPCIQSGLVSIETPSLTVQDYILRTAAQQFVLPAPEIQTTPINHSLCGSLTFAVLMNGVEIGPSSTPLSFTSSNRQFSVFTDDDNDLGTKLISVTASLTDYPSIKSAEMTVTLDIVDACPNPFSVVAPEQTAPPTYYYSANFPQLTFNLTPFEVDPNVCSPSYSCSVISGERTDLCSVQDGLTAAEFNTVTGAYTFQSTDIANYTPGAYVFEITGTVGTKQDTAQFTMILEDPCPTTGLTLQSNVFSDMTQILDGPGTSQEWMPSNILSSQTLAECGPITVEFFNDDLLQTALNSELFLDDRLGEPHSFKTVSTTEDSMLGQYSIGCRAYFSNYPQNVATSSSLFTITVADPCESSIQELNAPALIDQSYSITDDPQTYQIPEFIVTPSRCEVTYNYEITHVDGDSAVSFDSDASTRTFTFSYESDFSLSGDSFTDYIVTVIGTAGSVVTETNQATFNLKIKNPCIDENFVQISSPTLAQQLYTLYSPASMFTLTESVISTQPNEHSLCGPLSYSATFDASEIGSQSIPLAFVDADREFTIQTDDTDYLGSHEITLTGFLTNYPAVESQILTTTIEVTDACPNPFSVTATEQTSPPEYSYSVSGMQFNLTPFVVDPSACAPTYSCTVTSGDRTDLCSVQDGSTVAEFNAVTGDYTFNSSDMQNYKPGSYTFEITGTAGSKSAIATFTMTLVDPCPTTALFLDESVFTDSTYSLRDADLIQEWNISSMLISEARVDCGQVSFEFFNDDETNSALNGDLFLDNRAVEPHQFTTLETQEVAKTGTYPIKYRAFYTDYPANVVEVAASFTVTILNPCESINSITAPTLTGQTYTITDASKTYQIPPYPVEPAWCDITYTFEVSDTAVDLVVIFDQFTRTFTFNYSDDLLPSGSDSTDYTVTVTGSAGSVDSRSEVTTFVLTVANPCIDSNFVLVVEPPLLPMQYTLFNGAPDGQAFIHAHSSIQTSPITHSLCGDLSYSFTFSGLDIVENSDMTEAGLFSYSSTNQEFRLYTEQSGWIGAHEITLTAFLTSYPSVTSSPTLAELEILDACPDPNSVTNPGQTDPVDYYYTGSSPSLTFTLDPFLVDPSACAGNIVYTCSVTSGSRTDLCHVNDGLTEGIFNGVTGSYSFSTVDVANFQPGSYIFEIVGKVGVKSDTATFTVNFVDPCPTANLQLTEGLFQDQDYFLRDPAFSQSWNLGEIMTSDTSADCGTITVEFHNEDGSSLDSSLFEDNRTSEPYLFTILHTEDTVYSGTYKILYHAFYASYPATIAELADPFTINVIQPCASNIQSVTAPSLVDQVYTITSPPMTYKIPSFAVEPAWCEVTYSFTMSDMEVVEADAVTFNDNHAFRTFTFYYVQDNQFAGDSFKEYTVSVTGTAGTVDPVYNVETFTLRIQNPCIDSTIVSISDITTLLTHQYTLYQSDASDTTFSHELSTVVMADGSQNICGGISYTATFDGQWLHTISSPVTYDSGEFVIYSEDFELVGMHDVVLLPHLTDYPTTVGNEMTFQIEIVNVCLNPTSVTVQPYDVFSAEYVYGQMNIYQFSQDSDVFNVVPSACAITFSCEVIDGPRLDICNIQEENTGAAYDPQLPGYTFESIDVTNFPPGTYTFEITGTVGMKSDSITFEMVLIDPCPTGFYLKFNPFADTEYQLRGDAMSQIIPTTDIAQIDTLALCGSLSFEFFMDDVAKSPVDASIFESEIADGNVRFTVLQIQDSLAAGEYPIKYRVFFNNYQENGQESFTPFVYTIVDPCQGLNTITLTATSLEDQTYTITDTAHLYEFAAFTVEPVWCTPDYSFTVIPAAGANAITVNSDPVSPSVEFNNVDDLTLASASSKDYQVTIIGTVGSLSKESEFTLTLKNPCIDSNFVQLSPVPQPDRDYTLYDSVEFIYHDEFIVATSPFEHSLCGSLTYSAKVDDFQLTASSTPAAYSGSQRSFLVYSSDNGVVGKKTFTINAIMTNYSEVPIVSSSFIFEFIASCRAPISITPTVQREILPYKYSTQPAHFQILQFITNPPDCEVIYSCSREDGPDEDVDCNVDGVAAFDGVYDGDESDGTYSFETQQVSEYDEGIYTFTLTGVSGTQVPVTTSETFTLIIQEPCENAIISLLYNPFGDQEHLLEDNALSILFSLDSLYRVDTDYPCGDIDIRLYNADGSELDPDLFVVDKSGEQDALKLLKQPKDADRSILRNYPLNYRIYSVDHPGVYAEWQRPFIVTIADPCDNERLDYAAQPDWCPKPNNISTEIETSFEPEWLKRLEEEQFEFEVNNPGIEESLEYDLGDLLNDYGDKMDVRIKRGGAGKFVEFNEDSNSLRIDTSQLEFGDVGRWELEIEASYINNLGQEVVYDKKIYFTITGQQVVPPPRVHIEEDQEVFIIEEWLSDETEVAGRSWAQLKETALEPFYNMTEEFTNLTADEQEKIEALIEAQVIQNQEQSESEPTELAPQPYNWDNSITSEQDEDGNPIASQSSSFRWNGRIKESLEPEPFSPDQPLPYIVEMSSTGVMTIGWDRKMNQPTNITDIFPARIAARQTPGSSSRRNLEEVYFTNADNTYSEKMEMLDALEIKIIDEEGDKSDFSWDVLGFNEHFFWIKIDFDDPTLVASTGVETVSVTFWGTEYFKSYEDVEVRYGTTLYWKIFRQIDQDEASQIHVIETVLNNAGALTLAPVFTLVIFGGPLTTTWMFLNSLQLILHVPLLDTHMPANVHYFLKEYLSLTRFNIGPLNKYLETSQESLGISNFDLVQEGHQFYSVLFNSCGYKHNYFRNLFVIMWVFLVLALVALGIYARDHVNKRFVKGKRRSYVPWISNFILRFVYEAFFEVCICMVITAAAVEISSFKAGFFWCTSILGLIAIAGFIAFVASRLWINGPFVRDCYTEKSLLKSFWEIRPVNDDIAEEFYSDRNNEVQISREILKAPVLTPSYENSGEKIVRGVGMFEPDEVSEDDSSSLSSIHGKGQLSIEPGMNEIASHEQSDQKISEYTRDVLKNAKIGKNDGGKMSALGMMETLNIIPEDCNNVQISPYALDILGVKHTGKNSANYKCESKLSIRDTKEKHTSCLNSQGKMSALGMMDELNIVPNVVDTYQKSGMTAYAINMLGGGISANKQSESSAQRSALGMMEDIGVPAKNTKNVFLNILGTGLSPNRNILNKGESRQNLSSYARDLLGVEISDKRVSETRKSERSKAYEYKENSISGKDEFQMDSDYVTSSNHSAAIIDQDRPVRINIQNTEANVSASPASAVNNLSLLLRQQLDPQQYDQSKSREFSSHANTEFKPYETSNPRNCSAPSIELDDQFEGGELETERGMLESQNTARSHVRASDIQLRRDSFTDSARKGTGRSNTEGTERLSTVPDRLITERGMMETSVNAEHNLDEVEEEQEQEEAIEESKEEYRSEARMRLALEDEVELNSCYKTLFLGLKKNHPHNVAVIHPLIFLLRRVLYALIIVFMVNSPYFGSVLLMVSCFAMICYTVTESQWEDRSMNWLHVANECSFYVVCMFLLLFCGLVPSVYTRIFLGWCLIAFVVLTMVYNIATVSYTNLRYMKLVYRKYQTRQKMQKVQEERENSKEMPVFKAGLDAVETNDNEKVVNIPTPISPFNQSFKHPDDKNRVNFQDHDLVSCNSDNKHIDGKVVGFSGKTYTSIVPRSKMQIETSFTQDSKDRAFETSQDAYGKSFDGSQKGDIQTIVRHAVRPNNFWGIDKSLQSENHMQPQDDDDIYDNFEGLDKNQCYDYCLNKIAGIETKGRSSPGLLSSRVNSMKTKSTLSIGSLVGSANNGQQRKFSNIGSVFPIEVIQEGKQEESAPHKSEIEEPYNITDESGRNGEVTSRFTDPEAADKQTVHRARLNSQILMVDGNDKDDGFSSTLSQVNGRIGQVYPAPLEIEKAFGKELIESIAPTSQGRNAEPRQPKEWMSQQPSALRDEREAQIEMLLNSVPVNNTVDENNNNPAGAGQDPQNRHAFSDLTSCYLQTQEQPWNNQPSAARQRQHDPYEVDIELMDSMVRGSMAGGTGYGDKWLNAGILNQTKGTFLSTIDGQAGLSRLHTVEERVPVPEEIIAQMLAHKPATPSLALPLPPQTKSNIKKLLHTPDKLKQNRFSSCEMIDREIDEELKIMELNQTGKSNNVNMLGSAPPGNENNSQM